MSLIVEPIAPLEAQGMFRAAFIGRLPGLDVATERETALARLRSHHEIALGELGFSSPVYGQQVHGAKIAVVDASTPAPIPDVDGVITAERGLTLAVYVADCGAVYAADRRTGAIGLAHSGKKGTEQGILPVMLEKMQTCFGSRMEDMIVYLGPCIRPPHYEVDFAAEIIRQAEKAGVGTLIDSGICTAANPDRYYSYRMEKGRTGRMIALLMRP